MTEIDHAAELEAIEGWRAGDREAGARLLAMHRGTIAAVVRRYRGSRVDADDLAQEAALTLLNAASCPTFDPAISRFATYAGRSIARDALAYHRRARADLTASDDTHNSLAKLSTTAEDTDARADRKALARLRLRALRLEAPAHDDHEASLADTVQGSHRPADEQLHDHRTRALVIELVAGLDDQERDIIRRRYLDDVQEPQDEIALSMGCSGSNVSQLEIAALARLRKRAAWITRSTC